MSQGKRVKQETEPRDRKPSQKSKLDMFFKILTVVFIVITILFYISVLRLNMLPTLYTAIFSAIEVVITFLMVIGIGKKHKTHKLNVFCTILAIIICVVYVYATNYINETSSFLENVLTKVAETEEYYVVVRKDSTYSKIDDISGKVVNIFKIDETVQDDLKSNVELDIKSQDSLTDLGNNLINKKIDIIFVSSAQYGMLSDEIEKFEDDTKIIYTVKHNIEVSVQVDNETSNKKIENGVFNVYISGIDTSGSISNVSRSDANIVASVNTNTHTVLLTSIPRDYYVTLHSKKAKDKLTHSGIYGINETVTTVEDLLNTDINYYVRVNFTTLRKLVDTLGGVDVYSDYNFSAGGYSFTKGYNNLNGSQALAFSRERHSFAGGDNQRVKDQQYVIEAIMKKVLNSKTILTKYTSILDSMKGTFQTNISQDEISKIVKDQLNNMTSWSIKSNSLTGTGSTNSTYSMGSQQLYVMIPDSTSVSNAKEKIEDVIGK